MYENGAEQFLNALRGAVEREVQEQALDRRLPPIEYVLTDGESILAKIEGPEVSDACEKGFVTFNLPPDWILSVFPRPSRPGSRTKKDAFKCPHCGGSIKISK